MIQISLLIAIISAGSCPAAADSLKFAILSAVKTTYNQRGTEYRFCTAIWTAI